MSTRVASAVFTLIIVLCVCISVQFVLRHRRFSVLDGMVQQAHADGGQGCAAAMVGRYVFLGMATTMGGLAGSCALTRAALFQADGLLLSIASLGYMATSFVALFAFVEVASRVKNSAGMLQEVVRVLRIARACNVVFDFIYVADAVLYALAWAVDAEARKVAIAEEDALEREIGPSFRL